MSRVRTLLLCAVLPTLVCAPAAHAGGVLTRGHVPPQTRFLAPTGRVSAQAQIRLALGVPIRSAPALSNFLADVYNPASANFRKFLSGPEFAARFGPDDGDYQEVINFARSNGLAVVGLHSNRMIVDVTAPAAAIEKAFSIHLMTYRHPKEARDFFAPDGEPSAPGGVPILDITGLSDISPPRCLAHPDLSGAVGPRDGSATNGAYSAGDLRAAYIQGVTNTGLGQSVGLVEFDGYFPGDITHYETLEGLPPVCITNEYVDGYNGAVYSRSGNGEVSLDMEMVIAFASGISKLVVYQAAPTAPPNDILSSIASDDSCQAISCSWAWSGGPTAATDQILQLMAAQGQSFFCASGDSDAYTYGAVDNPELPEAPADNPYVTSVGGTTLATSGTGGGWSSERVWNKYNGTGSSGGFSSYYAIPAWQQSVSMGANGGSSAFRNIPDVACVAANIFVIYGNGASDGFNGTSCAAPIWASLTALANERAASLGLPPVGFANPALYLIGESLNYSSAFHDIVTGDNTSPNSPSAYFARPGYDLCAGWGSPIGLGLINALALPAEPLRMTPASGFNSAGLAAGPFTITSQNLALSNASAASQNWTAATSASWLSLAPTSGILPGATATNLHAALNTNAATLLPGNYFAAVTVTNLATGDVLNRVFTLTVLRQLTQNGGFETGDFSGWILSGNTNDTRVLLNYIYAHSGLYGAQFGAAGALGYLSQSLPTIAGQFYRVSLWFELPTASAPNELRVAWDGAILFDQTNLPQTPWTNLRFLVRASESGSTLQLGFRDDPAFIGLDDVSVSPVAAPTLLPVEQTPSGLRLTFSVAVGQTCQIQATTNLVLPAWQNLGPAMAASNSILSFTDTNAADAAKFYRVLLIP